MFLVLIPVMVPFFQAFGLSMEQIFQLQAIFGFGVALFEVPTGYIADLFGRKASLVVGSALSSLGFCGFVVGTSFGHFAGAEVVLALGAACISGSDEALLYDSLPREDRKRTAHAFANYQLSEQIGESVASLIGGFLATVSLAYAAWGNFWLRFWRSSWR